MQDAYESILDTYTPLDIKDIFTNGASRKAIHHKTEDDILRLVCTYNEGLHHNLLDLTASQKCFTTMFMQNCYNLSDKTHDDQFYFISDVVWLYIDAVAMS